MTDERPIRVSGLKFPEPVGKGLDRLADGSLEKTPLLAERAKARGDQRGVRDGRGGVRLQARGRRPRRCSSRAPSMPGHERRRSRRASDALPGRARRSSTRPTGIPSSARPRTISPFGRARACCGSTSTARSRDEVAALWPEEPFRLETIDDVRAAIDAMLPEAHGCPIMVAPSSGSMIVDAETGELVKGPGGWRVLIVVDDATQIPRILETIHLRCWARERVPLRLPQHDERLVLRAQPGRPGAGAADAAGLRGRRPLGSGLARAPDASAVFDEDGPYLVAASVVLSDEDRALAARNIEAARAILAPAAKKLRARRSGSTPTNW